jgi:hypothetical protein
LNPPPNYGASNSIPAVTSTRFNTPIVDPTSTPTPNYGIAPGPASTACTAGQEYYATLFEMDLFDGIMHWVDGTNGACRGLNGTNIGSVRIVSDIGGHPVYQRAANAFADGVTLRYYSDWTCSGQELGTTIGHTPIAEGINGARSVKIECNGRGSGPVGPVAMTTPVALKMFEGPMFQSIMHQQDGSEGECRGLNGTDLKSMQWLPSAISTEPMSDVDAAKYGVIFYDQFGCNGTRIGGLVGNKNDICGTTTLCSNTTFAPLSLKFVSPDLVAFMKDTSRVRSDATTAVVSAIALLVPAVAMLF